MASVLLIALWMAQAAWSQDPGVDAAALNAAQKQLSDPAKRADAAQNAEAAAAMASLEKLAGNPQNSQQMYELAAQLMDTLTKASGGNPEKMMKMLEDGKNDPEAFGKLFTPEQRKKLSDIAKALETGKLH